MNASDTSDPIAIIGAGIGGLVLALALLRKGLAVKVFEQAAELGEVGAGLSLPPNCVKVLKALGLEDKILAAANAPEKGTVHHAASGAILSETPFRKLIEYCGEPYLQMHRADMQKILVDAIYKIDANVIHLNHEFISFTEQNEQVTLRFREQSSVTTTCLIGCDGVRSAVRDQLFGKQKAKFTGFVAWRALVEMSNLPARFRKNESIVKVLNQRQVVTYPMTQGEILNVAAFAEQNWTVESWTTPADISEMREVYRNFDADTHTVIDAINTRECFKWALYDRKPLASWFNGRIALMGDAAHAMLPFLGQGAAMAVEDAWYLAALLAEESDIQTAFGKFQAIRHERTTWLQHESFLTGKRFGKDDVAEETFKGDRAMFTKKLFAFDPVADCATYIAND